MNQKIAEILETLGNAVTSHVEFPYYALVRITTRRTGTFHIPAPVFAENRFRSGFAISLPIAEDRRDKEYYACPVCGEKSFYFGPCEWCTDWMEDRKEDGGLYAETFVRQYKGHEAVKDAVKKEFLRRLDAGVPDLGIVSAEMVLPEDYDIRHSAFYRGGSGTAQRALARLEKMLEGVEIPEIEEPEEGEEILVEGSDEVRRQVNGAWQHKHPGSGYDYWHPLGRVHKEEIHMEEIPISLTSRFEFPRETFESPEGFVEKEKGNREE